MSKEFSFKNHMEFIKFIFLNKEVKHSVLDPLTCMIRCAILSFKPVGTKISICQNKINFIEPNILQGPIRWTYGDKREDLHNIYNPLKKAVEWYPKDNKDITNIFRLAKRGLEKLKSGYPPTSIISHSLELYINILDNYIYGNECKSYTNLEALSNNKKNDESLNKIYVSLKELWNDTQINIVNNIIVQVEQSKDKETKLDWLNALDIILDNKEKNVSRIIRKTATQLV